MYFLINYGCDATHHKPFGLVSTYGNEVRRRIVYILDDKIVFVLPMVIL